VQQDADGNKVAMVSVFPDLTLDEDVDVQTEMIFVIDRSGSMAGSRMTQGNTLTPDHDRSCFTHLYDNLI